MIDFEKYNRQIILPGFGSEGQELLQQASVLMIGAGGLGCPCLQYLVAAGVGTIGIADGDKVSLSNLHRQVLYGVEDIGKSKTSVAKSRLSQLNPSCTIIEHDYFIDAGNAFDLIEPYDMVIDGSDNFATRFLVNDVCVLLNKPLVYGAVQRFEGQVAVFNAVMENGERSAQYRDLYPDMPSADSIPNCAEAGVLGVLPGIIGTMQATEAIKLITGIGQPLINKVFTYNALSFQTYEFVINPTEKGWEAVPATRTLVEQYDYNFVCEPNENNRIMNIDAATFQKLLDASENVLIDVREMGELPLIGQFEHLQVPLSTIHELDESAIQSKDIVLFCQSGIRSKRAATILAERISPTASIYNLEGGIVSWLAYNKKLSPADK